MSIASRISRKIGRLGEDVLLNGSTTIRGIVQVMDSSKMRLYLDDTEIALSQRPVLYIVTEPGAPIAVNNTTTRDGRNFVVRKVALERFSGQSVVKIAVLV